MGILKDESISIYDAVQNIKDDKYVMPAFQRQFCWSMEQIEKLWDSILQGYPISTFLFWHIDDNNITADTKFCTFLNEISFDNRSNADSPNYNLEIINTERTDTAILDGQQRLTSLYLSLLCSAFKRQRYARRGGERILCKLFIELDKNKITVDEEEYNSKKYDIRFTDKAGNLTVTQFDIKKIMQPEFSKKETRVQAIEDILKNIPADSKEYASNILNTLCQKIYDEKLIRFVEILDMNQDDALEMFVRFNSGGTRLSKSEITMSILEAYWPEARNQFGMALQDSSYRDFKNDFIIRTALMLYGDVVKSVINESIANDLRANWRAFKIALKNLEKVLKEFKIDIRRFSSSWNVLLPVIYYIYNNPDYINNKTAIKKYLLRAILFSYFQSGTTSKLQTMKQHINNNNMELTTELLDGISTLNVTDGKIEDILNSEKGSHIANETLYYLSIDWLNPEIIYEADHLHPDSRFDKTKPVSITQEKWLSWRKLRNKIPNLHYLSWQLNDRRQEMPLSEFYNNVIEDKDNFRHNSYIPDEVSLDFVNFENFYEARKLLLKNKLKELLS